jgi:hypothetical protein
MIMKKILATNIGAFIVGIVAALAGIFTFFLGLLFCGIMVVPAEVIFPGIDCGIAHGIFLCVVGFCTIFYGMHTMLSRAIIPAK